MPDAAVDVRGRIEGIVHAERRGGFRHELHESLRPAARDGARVELGLSLDDGGNELFRHPVAGRRGRDEGVDVDSRHQRTLDRARPRHTGEAGDRISGRDRQHQDTKPQQMLHGVLVRRMSS